MFSFDQATLPQLTTRKALIVVDFQNDFLGGNDQCLPITEPVGFVERALKLAASFRVVGDVVWVQSQFDQVRPVDNDQIIVSDSTSPLHPASRSRRRSSADLAVAILTEPPDSEAFLSHQVPLCVKPAHPGCEMPQTVIEAMQKRDLVLTKSHYSAFQATHLLRMLRAKMVMEVYICGSLANIGVYATAMDAAGHGMAITVVENCCGYRSEARQISAVRNLVKLAGCEVASSEEVLETILPIKCDTARKVPVSDISIKQSSSSPSIILAAAHRTNMSPDIVHPMTSLRIVSSSPSPAVVTVTQDSKLQPCITVPDNNEAREPHEPIEGKTRPKPEEAIGTSTKASCISETTDSDVLSETDDKNTSSPPTEGDQLLPKQIPASSPDFPVLSTGESLTSTMGDQVSELTSKEQFLQRSLCEGDTDIIHDILSAELADKAFDWLRDEIQWQRMSHQGGEVPRLVAVQGEVADDGSIPIYRHPADESPTLLPFSPTVLAIRKETEKHLGHPLNHVLIQFYRDGKDYISEHSDKTLDIVKGSYICNISLGAERTMVFRTKRVEKDPSIIEPTLKVVKRPSQRARLPHNSLCRMGLKTNMRWLHTIKQDKRADRDKSAAELSCSGGRISLTFRQIGTFLDRDETKIWGQGATGKTRDVAQPVVNGQGPEAVLLLKAFGTENHASDFDWNAYYGKGFDVLHISSSPRLFLSRDNVVNLRIRLMLAEYGVGYARGSLAPTTSGRHGGFDAVVPIKFIDNDVGKSEVQGDLAIMLYLDSRYGLSRQNKSDGTTSAQPELARLFTRFQRGLDLLSIWRHSANAKNQAGCTLSEVLQTELEEWNNYATQTADACQHKFIAGTERSLADFAVWPVLNAIVEELGIECLNSFSNLQTYYETFAKNKCTSEALGKLILPQQKL